MLLIVRAKRPRELVCRSLVTHTRQVLAILRDGLASNRVRHAGLGHHISLIATVGKNPRSPDPTVHGFNRSHMLRRHHDATMLHELFVEMNLDTRFVQHGAKDLFANVRF